MPSEAQTRRDLIDPKLRIAGWRVVPWEAATSLAAWDRCAIEEYPTQNGPADYALCVEGRILGVVEAKRLTLGPQNVLTQAERYSKGVVANPFNFSGCRVPFLYSTNGEIIWYHDIRHPLNCSRRIPHYHTPEALVELLTEDFEGACGQLLRRSNDHPLLRPYQLEANTAIEQAVADRKRQMLVAMATGTGKTFTLVNQAYRLMKTGVARRILFLVDRRVLAAQAVRAFASFEAEPGLKFDQVYEVYSQQFQRDDFEDDEPFNPKVLPASYLMNPKPGHAFVYVCTIQRMAITLFGHSAVFAQRDEPEDVEVAQLDIPIHAFDLVIADECHRGYTSAELSLWRNTIEHFDALKVGLTATPAAHTTTYFKEVVYRYEYERAVREGYLVDYDVVAVKSDVRLHGIFLREGEQVGIIDSESGAEQLDLLEDERQFDAGEVEARVTAPDSNQKILEEIKKHAEAHQQRYGRFPKTLIFAVNDLPHTSHADQLVDLARDIFSQGDAFVQKITGRVDRPLQRIREFRNRKLPAVAVTVDLLSTGVDIPDLEFIVFFRLVKSRILFEQMLGRGTRKGEHLSDKSHFVVFDCFDGTLVEYFKQATAITVEPPRPESRTLEQVVEDIWQNRDRDYNIRCLVKRLQRVAKEMSGEAREVFAAHIPQGDVRRFAADLPRRLREDFAGTMALLRDPNFQDLVVNFPRAQRQFVVAYEAQDEVTSFRYAGKEYKAEDYLAVFAQFVRENADQIDAIRILLDRPRDWSTGALTELRQKLAAATPRFTVEILQFSHQSCYRKALVDLISMVKHAACQEEPLYTAEERVERAFARVTESQEFTPEQQQWLDRIRRHLTENLSLEKEDFESMPVFVLAGGWGRASRVFEGQLPTLIQRFNEAIAA